jgi:DNA-directed RNA polymerase specialized sigma subunit
MNTTYNVLYEIADNVEQKNVLDELSDGQWHPEYKIKKQVKNSQVLNVLQELNSKGILIAGNNNSFRMNGTNLTVWREITDFDKKDTPRYTPRFFGGILEDDGWLLAPLHNNNLIHFRMKYNISQDVLKNLLGDISLTRSEDGLYRVLCKENGKELYELIKNFENEEGQKVFSGVRLEENVKRRNMNDLPKKFASDLCVYYGNFAKVLLRPNMSSITKHISDTDDIQQQIYIWVIDAVQRYDHTTSIPFAAYLGKMLGKWVFNLNRQSFGRNIADVELKHSRAANKFREENDREPTVEELAKILGEEVSTVNNERNNINSVSNIRRVGTIDNDDSPVHLTTTEDITVKYEELINQTLLSAAVTASAAEKTPTNIIGWLNVYHQTWGDVKNKKLLPNADSKTVAASVETVLTETQKLLTKLEEV